MQIFYLAIFGDKVNPIDIQNSIFIIDGSSFLYRAYYSIRPLTDPQGRQVQAVYGFCRMVKRLIDNYKTKFIIIVWDSPGRTIRHDLYESYKETRQATPSDLGQQKQIIKEFADTIGLAQIQVPGIEADDIMYSLSKEFESQNISSIIVTSDKDMGQALSEKVFILDPFKDEFITKEVLQEKLGFNIEKLPFYFALIGDSSDNIPGVKGIGPKGATQLVKEFENLESLYDNLSTIAPRISQLLLSNKDNAFLSEKLFKLATYNLNIKADSCLFDELNWEKAYPLFKNLNFKSLIKNAPELLENNEVKRPALTEKYKFLTINNLQHLIDICNKIKEVKIVALDTESTSFEAVEGSMVGFSLCYEIGISYYIPFGHKTEEVQIEKKVILETIKPILEDLEIKKVLHHAKFDSLMLASEGIDLKGNIFDTMIAANLVALDGQRIGLKYLSEFYLEEYMYFFKDLVNKKNYKDFSYVPLDKATEYAAADAHQTLQLYYKLKSLLHEHNLIDLFENIEMPLMTILLNMEKEGILIDLELLEEIDKKVIEELSTLRAQIIDVIGPDFSDINLNSPKQLEELLFKHLQLPVIKKTTAKTGYSTDQEVLVELTKFHPVASLILKYREVFKIKSTYIEGLSKSYNFKTKRIHTTFSQTVVATGRLSSSEPNLQNIPVDKFNIRSLFKVPEDKYLISADYSQIELRVLAFLSQDETLIKAFNSNMDIHNLTAATLFSIDSSLVTSEQRQFGKKINFSILYGLTAHGLSKDLDISHKLAKEYIDKYMARYPGVVDWSAKVIEEVTKNGYVTTHWGRRRYIPGIYERNRTLYDLAKRVAINTKAQGTAADIMKLGMINLDKQIKSKNLKAKILLQIHDELLIEVPTNELNIIESIIPTAFNVAPEWNVPLIVNLRKGKNWQEITK